MALLQLSRSVSRSQFALGIQSCQVRWQSSIRLMSTGSLSLVDFSMSHADFSHCKTQQSMVDSLEKLGALKTKSVCDAFRAVDRALFIPTGDRDVARYAEPYQNAPQKLFHGATISTPHHHAVVLELCAPSIRSGGQVLDLGCGTGYLSAVFAHLVGPQGSVIGTDRIPSCLEHAKRTIPKCLDSELASTVRFIDAYESSTSHGIQVHNLAPQQGFDIIHSGFAMQQSLAKELCDSLAPGGVLVTAVYDNQNGLEQQNLCVLKPDGVAKVVMPVMCQAMEVGQLDEASLVEVNRLSHKEQLEQVQDQLKSWRNNFEQQHGNAPSREDMAKDPLANELFQKFSKLRSRVWEK